MCWGTEGTASLKRASPLAIARASCGGGARFEQPGGGRALAGMNDIVRCGLAAALVSISGFYSASPCAAHAPAAAPAPAQDPAAEPAGATVPAQGSASEQGTAPAGATVPAQGSASGQGAALAPASTTPESGYPVAGAPPVAPPYAPPAYGPPSPYQPPPYTVVPLVQPALRQGREPRRYDGPPTLFGSKRSLGGYGGFAAAYTHMLHRDGAALGFEGALSIAHRLSLGLAGYGFSRNPQGPVDVDGARRDFGTGYGGFVARYAFLTSLPVYPSLGILLGGGAVVLHRDDWNDHNAGDGSARRHDGSQGDGFFVAQPELQLHANVTRWMRLGLNAGYRFTRGVSRFGFTERDLNGVLLGGNIQFGWI